MAPRANPTPRLDPDIARLAGVLADPSRVAMLDAMLDGGAHTMGALARHAGVTAATASGHLRRLIDEQLVTVSHHGRERRVRLAGPTVAQLLESLAVVAHRGPAAHGALTSSNGTAVAPAETQNPAVAARIDAGPAVTASASVRAKELRFARFCYDHLAGVIGVRVTGALLDRGWLVQRDDGFDAAPSLLSWLADQGHPLSDEPRSRRPLARACLDWSERIPHVAGRVGAALGSLALASHWFVRVRNSRTLRLTARGKTALARELAVTFA
jgi:DNA-binding transcriptional ArsR family regulator